MWLFFRLLHGRPTISSQTFGFHFFLTILSFCQASDIFIVPLETLSAPIGLQCGQLCVFGLVLGLLESSLKPMPACL